MEEIFIKQDGIKVCDRTVNRQKSHRCNGWNSGGFGDFGLFALCAVCSISIVIMFVRCISYSSSLKENKRSIPFL